MSESIDFPKAVTYFKERFLKNCITDLLKILYTGRRHELG